MAGVDDAFTSKKHCRKARGISSADCLWEVSPVPGEACLNSSFLELLTQTYPQADLYLDQVDKQGLADHHRRFLPRTEQWWITGVQRQA